MYIYVHRHYLGSTYTIGRMYVNGEYYCDSLEDKDRGLSKSLTLERNKAMKVYGKTAIPIGVYQVGLHKWTKYNIVVPILQNVPAFEGILIHNGKNENNTEGCILVGENTIKGQLTNGYRYMTDLTNMIRKAIRSGESVKIEIGWSRPPYSVIKQTGSSLKNKKTLKK